MKKQLLLGAMLFGSFLVANAQDSCEDALAVDLGMHTVSGINGEYTDNCFAAADADEAEWFSYSPTQTGLLTISTVLDSNPGGTAATDIDTRLSVFMGACGELVCYAANDDVAADDFRSELTIGVGAGETYYFSFDNNWQELEFDFELTFEEVSCLPVAGGFAFVGTPTTTEVTISWLPAPGSPEGYEVLYGETGFDPETEGEALSVDEPQATMDGLTAGTDYDLYVRTDCGGGDFSEWTGPITFSSAVEPATPPYASGFEEGEDLAGWTIFNNANGAPWQIAASSQDVPSFDGDLFAQAGASINPTDVWLFSRGLNLTGGNSYTVSYYAARFALAGAGNVNNLEVTYGDAATVAAQTNVLATFDNYSEDDYVQQEQTFTAPETGVYYIGFNYTGPAHVQANFGVIAVDNFEIQDNGVAGVNNPLASKLSVFPNPANNVVNIANADNILVNGVVIADMNGRTVKSAKFNGVTEAQISVADLASGVYMMTISSDKGTMTTKVVKN